MAAKKTSKKTAESASNEVRFEDALGELESLIEAMEGEDLPLDDLVASYSRGMELWKVCQQRLDNARLKVDAISARSTEEEMDVEEFDPQKTAPEPSKTADKKLTEDVSDDEIKLF